MKSEDFHELRHRKQLIGKCFFLTHIFHNRKNKFLAFPTLLGILFYFLLSSRAINETLIEGIMLIGHNRETIGN